MATIDSLAPELLSEIFEYLPRGTLCHSALVCRQWRESAQRSLFKTVTLRSWSERNAWLQSPARSRYRTKSLEVQNIASDGSGYLPDTAFEACPDLKALTLGIDGSDGGHEWCVGDSLRPDLSSVESLHLMYPQRFPYEPDPLVFPNLRHLEVELNGVLGMMPGAFSRRTLKAIFSPFCKSLVSLRLNGLIIDTTATRLVKVLSAAPFVYVRHLSLEGLGIPSLILRDLLSTFPSLITLEFAEPGAGEDYIAGELISSTGDGAPATLQNLIFNIGLCPVDEEAITELLRVIKLPNLKGLRSIEIPIVSKDELASEPGLALLDECEERSISLLCRYGYLTRAMM